MVVEAVDRIFGLPIKRTPLKAGQPVILEESDLMCQGTESGYPILSATSLNPDQLKIIDYTDSTEVHGTSFKLTKEEITKANLEFAQSFPLLKGIFGISKRIEWRPSQRKGRR